VPRPAGPARRGGGAVLTAGPPRGGVLLGNAPPPPPPRPPFRRGQPRRCPRSPRGRIVFAVTDGCPRPAGVLRLLRRRRAVRPLRWLLWRLWMEIGPARGPSSPGAGAVVAAGRRTLSRCVLPASAAAGRPSPLAALVWVRPRTRPPLPWSGVRLLPGRRTGQREPPQLSRRLRVPVTPTLRYPLCRRCTLRVFLGTPARTACGGWWQTSWAWSLPPLSTSTASARRRR